MLSNDPERDRDDGERHVEIAGGLDRHAAEMLRLEIERMARLEGIVLTVTVRRADAADSA
jgi:hypothetical protein